MLITFVVYVVFKSYLYKKINRDSISTRVRTFFGTQRVYSVTHPPLISQYRVGRSLLFLCWYYTPPFGALATLATAIATLQATIVDIEAGVLGAEAAKVDAKRDVMRLLKKALNYINDIAFDRQDVASEVITGARMLVNKPISQDKQDLKAVIGPGTGVVRLLAKALKYLSQYQKATYEWQFSIDQGSTWENIPFTHKAKVTVTGMLPGIETWFRKRDYSEKTGMSAWSDYVSIYPL